MRLAFTLSRGFDLRSFSNIAVFVASIGIALLTVIPMGFEWALRAALANILVWSMARETDPDHPLGAVAVLLVAVPFFFLVLPSLLLLFFLILGARYLNLTPGKGIPTVVDMLVVFTVALLTGWFVHWFYLLLASGIFGIAILLGNGRWNMTPTVLSFIAMIVAALFSDPEAAEMARIAWTFMAMSFMLGFIVLFHEIHVRSVGDRDQVRLINVRVMSGTLVMMLATIPTIWLGWVPWAVVVTIWIAGFWNLGSAAFGPDDREEE